MLRKSTSPLHFDRSGSFGMNDNFTKKKKGGGEIEKKKSFPSRQRILVITFLHLHAMRILIITMIDIINRARCGID